VNIEWPKSHQFIARPPNNVVPLENPCETVKYKKECTPLLEDRQADRKFHQAGNGEVTGVRPIQYNL